MRKFKKYDKNRIKPTLFTQKQCFWKRLLIKNNDKIFQAILISYFEVWIILTVIS